MANYLVVKGSNQTKSYALKTTHNSVPYLKVSNSYLDLTTNTTTGIQLKVKEGNNTSYTRADTVTSTYSTNETFGEVYINSTSSTSSTSISSSINTSYRFIIYLI